MGEYVLDEQLVESEPADQQEPEQRVKHCRLHFDEDVVAQIEREAAEDQHDDGGKEGHGRQTSITNVSCSQREQNGRHETRGRGEYAEILVRTEEYDERPQIERDPDQMKMFFPRCS